MEKNQENLQIIDLKTVESLLDEDKFISEIMNIDTSYTLGEDKIIWANFTKDLIFYLFN